MVSKPSTDPIYPAYVVGDADRTSETSRVAAVTGQRSGTNQLEDLLRRLLTTMKSLLLQRMVVVTQSRPPPVVSSPAPTELEQMLRHS